MFRLSKLSLANRSVVALLTAIIAVFGFLSLGSLKQELVPSIEVPSAAIVTVYPGASPEVVNDQVSTPIESAIVNLDDLESTTVTSTAGLSVIRISFAFGTTAADATERLNNALSSIEGQLPADVQPEVISGSFDSVPIIVLAVAANDGDNEAIAEDLKQSAPALFSQINGVRDVAVSGVIEKRVNIDLNQIALAQAGLTQRDIATALTANGLVLPVGTLADDQGSIAVQIGSAVDTIEEFEKLPLISPSTGASVSLDDVADVTYENAPITTIARTNGKPSLAVSITKTPDGNSVAVSHGVEEKISELEEALGGDVTVTTVFDQAPFIEKSIEDLTTEGLLGLTFAVIVILVFLLSFKSTIITAISIPTSVLITFIGLLLADYSLNILTLGALTIAIGRVVDDSIVVIENINRHIAYGETRKKAVLTAVREVAGAITASTITTVAVFLPIALVDGLVGELFRPFAFTVAIALLASLLVSLTIVPVLAYWFLRLPKKLRAEQEANPKKFAKEQRHIQEEKELKGVLQRAYVPIIRGTNRHPWLTLFASILILVFTFSLVPQLKTNFIGGSGSPSFSVRVNLGSGATFDEQNRASKKVEDAIREIEGVEVVQATIGNAADGRVAFGAAASGVSISVDTAEEADVEAIKTKVLEIEAPAGGEITISTGPGFGSSETIDIKVKSSDEEDLQDAVDLISQEMAALADISNVTSTLDADERVLEIKVDRDKAARYLLTENQVSGIVAAVMRPSAIGRLTIENNETSVYITGNSVPETIDEVSDIKIPTALGLVALSDIAEIKEVLKPTSITAERGDRTATVALATEGEDLGAVSASVTEKLADIELPVGVEASIGGAAADQAESFAQLGIALLAAIAIVYIVMVATFSSLIQPLLLLISIPFAATGALGLLLITDTPLGVPALIGMLMLIGIVVTNAIVLIDLVNQYRKQGRTVQDSLISGARQRLRPILMTALATIFALTPMSLGITGGGGFISQPLAIVVIGGLFSSTLLTLILVPTLYWLVEGKAERKTIRIEKRANKNASKAAKNAEKLAAKQAKLDAKQAKKSSAPDGVPAAAPAAPIATPVAVVAEPTPSEVVAPDPVVSEAKRLEDELIQAALEPDAPAEFVSAEPMTRENPVLSWSEPKVADIPSGNASFSPAGPSKRELKKAEKEAMKAQKKAAKDSRHRED